MRYAALTLALFTVASCDLFDASPGVPVCSQHVDIVGDYPKERIRDAADHACRKMLDATDLTEGDIDALPPVTVRVYSTGETTHRCTHARSGTCTDRTDDGYHIDVRQEPHNPEASPAHVDDRVTHEMMHVLAFELGVPASDHHRWMLKRNVCAEMCTYSNPLD